MTIGLATRVSGGGAALASTSVHNTASTSGSNACRYRRLTQEDSTDNVVRADQLKKQRAETLEKLNTKCQALFWTVLGALVLYYTDFFHVIFSDPRVDRFYFNVASICLSINTVITFYLVFWLPYVQKITLDWSIYCPRLIPTATFIGFICGFSLIRSLWPIWGFLTPLIILLGFMSFMFSLHFIPWPF